jgi:hypothetical protein
MTMHNASHPDDERLAAYAGADRDALSDRELVAHVAACDRCRPVVHDLMLLRDALAILPDLAPSRPLRLIPPVPAPAAPRVGPLEWLRRLAAPAMAAGAGLVLIGAVGASGVVTELGAKDASRNLPQEAGASNGAHVPAPGVGTPSPAAGAVSSGLDFLSSGKPRGETPAAATSPSPRPTETQGSPVRLNTGSGDQPWLTLLVAGFALFGISAVLRYSLSPRAG